MTFKWPLMGMSLAKVPMEILKGHEHFSHESNGGGSLGDLYLRTGTV